METTPIKGFMVFDTETNGLMDYKRPADAPGQPRVAEFAAILLDAEGNVEQEFQRYIKPPWSEDGPDWLMTLEATTVNKITDEVLLNEGVPIKEVLEWYGERINEGYAVVAFGAQFDCKMMRSEFRRAEMDDLFERTRNVCLMRSARPFAKSIGREIIKAGGSNKGWPKNTDLANFLGVIYDPATLHGALCDARMTTANFRAMLDLGFVPEPEVHHAKNYEEIRDAK
ncbi:3'-5' exonuclease [Sphingomonas sp.]|uniref:3'-5' exonuclease n=1 Tax=Sphingomonas sp. TaxID=28214 RepID=UPI0025DE36B7|nr:3'-5' exonuclease [Sphingomonas sp.]